VNGDSDPLWKKLVGWLLLPFALLLVPFIPILNWLGWNKMNAKPEYVIEYLEKFIAGTEGPWDWDDFSSIPLTNPKLENIRERACDFGPWARDYVDVAAFEELLKEARALQNNSD
jgi:hypothetical protein